MCISTRSFLAAILCANLQRITFDHTVLENTVDMFIFEDVQTHRGRSVQSSTSTGT